MVLKPGTNNSWILEGSLTNNDTKGTPCYMGDIFGDWREEFIMRTANNNIRIYTTTIETKWRNYSLWYDHQYRNGMVWQMCGYNQPAHTSYFLGELEGITVAPPALTMEGRTEIANGGTTAHNGEEVITCEANDMTININSIYTGEKLWLQRVEWEWVSREVVYDDEVGKVKPYLIRTREQVDELYKEQTVNEDTVRAFLIDRIRSDEHFVKRCLSLLADDKLLQRDMVSIFKDIK